MGFSIKWVKNCLSWAGGHVENCWLGVWYPRTGGSEVHYIGVVGSMSVSVRVTGSLLVGLFLEPSWWAMNLQCTDDPKDWFLSPLSISAPLCGSSELEDWLHACGGVCGASLRDSFEIIFWWILLPHWEPLAECPQQLWLVWEKFPGPWAVRGHCQRCPIKRNGCCCQIGWCPRADLAGWHGGGDHAVTSVPGGGQSFSESLGL